MWLQSQTNERLLQCFSGHRMNNHAATVLNLQPALRSAAEAAVLRCWVDAGTMQVPACGMGLLTAPERARGTCPDGAGRPETAEGPDAACAMEGFPGQL